MFIHSPLFYDRTEQENEKGRMQYSYIFQTNSWRNIVCILQLRITWCQINWRICQSIHYVLITIRHVTFHFEYTKGETDIVGVAAIFRRSATIREPDRRYRRAWPSSQS